MAGKKKKPAPAPEPIDIMPVVSQVEKFPASSKSPR